MAKNKPQVWQKINRKFDEEFIPKLQNGLYVFIANTLTCCFQNHSITAAFWYARYESALHAIQAIKTWSLIHGKESSILNLQRFGECVDHPVVVGIQQIWRERNGDFDVLQSIVCIEEGVCKIGV